MRILPLQKLLSFMVMLCAALVTYAQPANDDCSTPTLMALGADAASCVPVPGDTRMTVDATAVAGPEVCSGSWYTDDVWYSVETGADVPEFGITVEVRLDPTSGTELTEHGMGIYLDCETTTMALDCFSDEPGRRTMTFPPQCLAPNSTYLVRIWSAPAATDNSGTFEICAYAAVDDGGGMTGETARVIYEETFDKGLEGWTSVAESMTMVGDEMLPDDWMWSNTGCFPNAFGSTECLTISSEACREVGVVGIPAGWYQTGRTGDVGQVSGPPYADIISYLVSPTIDLSKESCVELSWIESHRGLNGSGVSRFGPTVEYSIDGGETWNAPSQAIGSIDVSTNYGGTYVVNAGQNAVERKIPLIGAENNADVRVRFGFNGDFYFWIIDNIRVVEGTTNDIRAQPNFVARAPINPMSIHQIDSYDFLMDVVNLSCGDQENVNLNVTGVNAAGEEVHNVNLAYGTIMSDSLAENQAFGQPYSPPAIPGEYTFTYTLTSDADDDLTNNTQSFTSSVVDETVFRKETGTPNGALSPNDDDGVFWEEGEPRAWEMGNCFYATSDKDAVNGWDLKFTEISFMLDSPNFIAGEALFVWLYKFTDNDFDGILDLDDPSEIQRLAIGEYVVTGMETGMVTVQLAAFSGNDDDLLLEANTHYMASVQSNITEFRADNMRIADNDSYDYSAAIFNARDNAGGDLTKIRYAHSFAINKENYFRISPSTTGDLTTGNFNESTTPVIRLNYIVIPPGSANDINDAIKIAVSPNPASEDITVNLDMDFSSDMKISIVDLSGRLIMEKNYTNVSSLKENYNVSNFTNGVYFLHIETNDGIQTQKFVVSK